jgi:excisionase family DNA binding protein
LLDAVRELANGKAVSLVAVNKDLTTQQAADLLNVSRPYLITLLERGELPFHKVGSHRRVPLVSLLDYKQLRDQARRTALAQMAQEARDSGLYQS